MNFKHVKNLQESIDGMKKIFGISWSPNLQRLAVAHVDERRMVRISLYDETCKKREMFQTKPANKNSKSYVVKEIAFSPDSTKLAVCQSDCIIFVYNLGRNWGDKKVICNKFEQNFPVTAMIWPNKKINELFFGVADGKVKKAILKNNSAQALYSTGSFVIALSYNLDNTHILSSHMDNSIYCYNIEKGSSIKISTTPTISYCLSYLLHNKFLSSSLGKKIFIHDEKGEIYQTFDYSNDPNVKDFSVCKVNTNFDIIAVGNYNKLFIYGYNNKQIKWEESCIVEIENYFSFTALCWKQDFGILITGSLCGSLDMFESCLKKNIINDKYEITYISLQQITIKDIEKERRISVKTNLAPEILKVEIKNNNFLVITTENSLIVGDLTSQKYSEVTWNHNTGEERFDFNNLNICLVYASDEVAVIEFGNNEIIGYFRTEYCHPNLISARIVTKMEKNIKLITYLVDPNTIYIHDLITQSVILNYNNDNKIEYLEFGKSGSKLIYRDASKKLNLLILDKLINSSINENNSFADNNELYKNITLLNLCSFVQWVPNTEILVAQSHNEMFIWYNLENYQNPQIKQINGNIDSIAKNKGKIEIFINDINESEADDTTSVNGKTNYKIFLDDNLVELSIALDDKELAKALMILENLPKKNENKYYWKILSEISLEEKNLMIAQRCFAALDNFPKIKYLKNLLKEQIKNNNEYDNNNEAGNKVNINALDENNINNNGKTNQILVDAKILLMKKKYEEVKKLLLDNNLIKEAIDIFKDIHKYLDAIEIAEEYKLPQSELMKKEYLDWLISNEMYDEVAKIKIKEGLFIEAVKYYIQGDMQVKASNLIIKYRVKIDNNTLTYLINSINELGLTDIAKKLKNYINEINN